VLAWCPMVRNARKAQLIHEYDGKVVDIQVQVNHLNPKIQR